MQNKCDSMLNKGNSSSRGRVNFRGPGRGNNIRHHQLKFCNTEINRMSDEIESV